MAALCGQSLQLHRSAYFGTKLTVARPQRVAAPCAFQVQAGRIGPGKRWEHYELTKNFKPVRIPVHVKSGDTVKIIAGSDKGTVGKITKVNTKTGTVIVEGVNIKTKHVKPTVQGEAGQIVKKEFPVHHSNVQLYSTEKQVASRIGYKVLEDGRKVRYLKKTGEIVD